MEQSQEKKKLRRSFRQSITQINTKENLSLIHLVGKIIFHYLDQISDLMVALIYVQESRLNAAWIPITAILFFSQIYERINNYLFILQIAQELKKQNKQQNEKPLENQQISMDQSEEYYITRRNSQVMYIDQKELNLKEKIGIFIVVFLFLEYFYILKVKNKVQVGKILMKKDVIQLFSENFIYLMASYNLLLGQWQLQQQNDILVYFSALTSSISCVYIIHNFYMFRIQRPHYLDKKDEKSLQDYKDDEIQLITNPYILGCFKYLADKNKDNMSQSEQKKSKFSQAAHFSVQISNWKKVYILFYICIHVYSTTTIFALTRICKYNFSIEYTMILGFFGYIYQVCKFWSLNIKILNTSIAKFKFTLKLIMLTPLYTIVGLITLLLPIKYEKIPFVKEIKENWFLNFFPSWFTNLFQWIISCCYLLELYSVLYMESDQFVHPKLKYQTLIMLRKEGSPFKIILEITIFPFLIQTLLNFILYSQEILLKIKQNKNSKREESSDINNMNQSTDKTISKNQDDKEKSIDKISSKITINPHTESQLQFQSKEQDRKNEKESNYENSIMEDTVSIGIQNMTQSKIFMNKPCFALNNMKNYCEESFEYQMRQSTQVKLPQKIFKHEQV